MKGAVALAIWVALILLTAVSTEAQQPTKIPRIGILGSTAISGAGRSRAIRQALRDIGYIDGQNVAFEERYRVDSDRGRHDDFAVQLVRLKVDVIVVAGGNDVVRDAMAATKTIPIVLMGQGTDPVVAGFVQSLARPGGNVTGLSTLSTHLGGKRLELLKEAVPKLVRVAVLHNPAQPGTRRELKEDLPPAARALGLTLEPREVRDTVDFDKIFVAFSKARPDGLFYMAAGALMRNNERRTADLALKNRLPTVFSNRAVVEAGGLLSYGADPADTYRRVAYYVDRILKGTKPADLPVEQPIKFVFVINLKTAKQIGLEIPQWTLMKADRVIK